MTQNDFAFRIDRWTDDGERIVEHVAGAEDFQIAMATYHAARKRWPKAAMTLRQDRKSILRLAILPTPHGGAYADQITARDHRCRGLYRLVLLRPGTFSSAL